VSKRLDSSTAPDIRRIGSRSPRRTGGAIRAERNAYDGVIAFGRRQPPAPSPDVAVQSSASPECAELFLCGEGLFALIRHREFQIVCTRFAYFSHETRLTSLVVALDENPHSASVLLQTNLAPACRWGLCFSANSAARPCGKTENVPEIQRVSGRNRTSR
jgi:hypothetical protein